MPQSTESGARRAWGAGSARLPDPHLAVRPPRRPLRRIVREPLAAARGNHRRHSGRPVGRQGPSASHPWTRSGRSTKRWNWCEVGGREWLDPCECCPSSHWCSAAGNRHGRGMAESGRPDDHATHASGVAGHHGDRGLGTGSMAMAFAATVANRRFVARGRGSVTGLLMAASVVGQFVFPPIPVLDIRSAPVKIRAGRCVAGRVVRPGRHVRPGADRCGSAAQWRSR